MKVPVRWRCFGRGVGIGLLLVLVTLGQAHGEKRKWNVYRLDEGGRYLELSPNTNGGNGFSQQTRHTKSGDRYLQWSFGCCDTILQNLHQGEDWNSRHVPLGPGRIFVETENMNSYSVIYDRRDKKAFNDIVTQLGLEASIEKRKTRAWILQPTDNPAPALEPYRGKPKWPDLKKESESKAFSLEAAREINKGLSQGAIYNKKGLYYFDGVTFDELARFIEEENGTPVVNKMGKGGRYSFTIPSDPPIWKRFTIGKTPTGFEALGMKISWTDQEEMDVVVVRDKKGGATGKLPLPAVELEDPPGPPSERIPELLGRWRKKSCTYIGQPSLCVLQRYFAGLTPHNYDICYDGHGFHAIATNGHALAQKQLDELYALESWKIHRWGKFYRATNLELLGGEWQPTVWVLIRLDGNTLHWCSIEAVPPEMEDLYPPPKDFSREELNRGAYIIFERVNDTPKQKRWASPKRSRHCRHLHRTRCRGPVRRLQKFGRY